MAAMGKEIVVGVTGASGSIYAARLLSALEGNGAVDFRPLYAPPGCDVYADVLRALAGSTEALALAGAAADAR